MSGYTQGPLEIVEAKTLDNGSQWHVYLAAPDGRKIAALWGGQDEKIANARLFVAAHDMLAALLLLTGNPHICLDDLVYTVREREGQGWDGPAVLAWSQAVQAAKAAIAKADGRI